MEELLGAVRVRGVLTSVKKRGLGPRCRRVYQSPLCEDLCKNRSEKLSEKPVA